MVEDKFSGSTHERRVTWSLIVLVIVFVVAMTCIVLWITTSLIRNQLGGSNPAEPGEALITETLVSSPAPLTTTSIAPLAATSTLMPQTTLTFRLFNVTWTPVPGDGRYVRFVTFKMKPNKIQVGECVQITWETENTVKLQLYRNDELYLEEAPISATLEDCPTELGYTVYRLAAENSAGESNWVQLQVRVVKAP